MAERSTVEILRAARERITPEEAWTEGAFGRDAEGYRCPIDAAKACRWCVEGSLALELLEASSPGHPLVRGILRGTEAHDQLCAAAEERLGTDAFPAEVNDRYGHDGALALLDRAVELAEAAS